MKAERRRDVETTANKAARIAREEAVITKAEADIDGGLGIDDGDLEAWLDVLDCDEMAPLPSPRARRIAVR